MRLKDMIRGNLLPLLAMLLLLVIFFGKSLLLGDTRFPMDRLIEDNFPWRYLDENLLAKNRSAADSVWYNFPTLAFLRDSFKSLQLPLWNPYILSGVPFQMEWISITGLITLLSPLPFAYDANMFISLFIALIGMYLFLRGVVEVNQIGALIGAITFGFSGFLMMWLHQTYTIGGSIFLPLNLYFLGKALSRKSIPMALAGGVTIALANMNGLSQFFLYNLFAVTAFFIFKTAPLIYKGFRREALQNLSYFLIIMGVGFCLSAVHTFPYLQMLQLSYRPDVPYAQSINPEGDWGAMPLRNLITHLIPDFFGNWNDRNIQPGVAYTEKINYLGILPLMLAVVAIFSEKNRHTYFFIGLSLLSLLIALGTPIYAVFYYLFPILAKARAIARINILVAFSIAVLAAIGMHNLTEGKVTRRTFLLTAWFFLLAFITGWFFLEDKIVEKPKTQFLLQFLIWLTSLMAIAFFAFRTMPEPKGRGKRLFTGLCVAALIYSFAMTIFFHISLDMHTKLDYSRMLKFSVKYSAVKPLIEYQFPSQWHLLYIPLAAGVLLVGVYLVKSKEAAKNIFYGAFIFLAAYDLMGFGARLEPYTDNKIKIFPETPGIQFLKRDKEVFRILPTGGVSHLRDVFPADTNIPYGLHSVQGYESITPMRYNRLLSEVEFRSPFETADLVDSITDVGFGNVVAISNYASRVIDMLNVKYVVTHNPIKTFGDRFQLVSATNDLFIYKNRDYLPRAFIVSDVKVENDGEKILQEIFSDNFDPRREAIIETKMKVATFSPSDPLLIEQSSATIKEYKNNSVAIEVDMKDRGMLVLSDNYYPGWKVFIDGKEDTIYRANYTLRGVFLEKGVHEVYFAYGPLPFKIGFFLSLTTGVGVLLYFIWYGLYSKRRV